MSHSPVELLKHISDEVEYLISNSNNLDFDTFSLDPTLIRAYSRSIEIIGEATKKLPKEFTAKYSFVPWKNIAGMRDKLIHEYFGIDLELVWDVVQTNIPQLKSDLQRIFNDLNI